MGFTKWFVTNGCKFGLSFAYRVLKEDWDHVPKKGPLIIFSNHTGMIEVPIMYTQLYPRPVTGLGKAELWDNWFLSFIFKTWGVIPIKRGASDLDAMRTAVEALKAGVILGIAPEGTRNKTGKLQRAHPGLVVLSQHSQSPLIPIAHWGGEKRKEYAKRWRRAPFHIKAGRPFRLDPGEERLSKDLRQAMADEMMYQLAKLLPEEYRGEYSDLSKASEKYIRYIDEGAI